MIFGYFANAYGAFGNPRIFGYLITIAVTLGYGGSNFYYYKAGKAYEKMMIEKDIKKAAKKLKK